MYKILLAFVLLSSFQKKVERISLDGKYKASWPRGCSYDSCTITRLRDGVIFMNGYTVKKGKEYSHRYVIIGITDHGAYEQKYSVSYFQVSFAYCRTTVPIDPYKGNTIMYEYSATFKK